MQVVCGGKWTADGRWVVVAEWFGTERIVYDPGNGNSWYDLMDCLTWKGEQCT